MTVSNAVRRSAEAGLKRDDPLVSTLSSGGRDGISRRNRIAFPCFYSNKRPIRLLSSF